jgi:fumarylacetoacetase
LDGFPEGETAVIDASNDRALKSWCESAQDSDFPIQNLPLGIFSVGERRRRTGVAIGDYVLDLVAIADLLDEDWHADLSQPVLNGWLSRGLEAQRALRSRLVELLSDEQYRDAVEPHLVGQSEVRLHVPCLVGDYTDFYVGIHHATNVGKQFRRDNPLLPNYKYVPIGYHGRASSVRASGEPVIRPSGQRKSPDADAPDMDRAGGSITNSNSASGLARAMSSGHRSRSARRRTISPAIAC